MFDDMGIELELGVLLVVTTVACNVFAEFEIETPRWRRLLKWTLIHGLTLGLYFVIGHWALMVPLFFGFLGGTVHLLWCRKHGIHPLYATPKRRYYQLRGWTLEVE